MHIVKINFIYWIRQAVQFESVHVMLRLCLVAGGRFPQVTKDGCDFPWHMRIHGGISQHHLVLRGQSWVPWLSYTYQ